MEGRPMADPSGRALGSSRATRGAVLRAMGCDVVAGVGRTGSCGMATSRALEVERNAAVARPRDADRGTAGAAEVSPGTRARIDVRASDRSDEARGTPALARCRRHRHA